MFLTQNKLHVYKLTQKVQHNNILTQNACSNKRRLHATAR